MAQERWNRGTDGTGCEAPEGINLCANNCGFFGSSATRNLYSKCYKDLILKEAQATSAMAAIEKSFVVGSVATNDLVARLHVDEPSCSKLFVDVAGPSSISQAVADSSSMPPPPKTPNRYFSS